MDTERIAKRDLTLTERVDKLYGMISDLERALEQLKSRNQTLRSRLETVVGAVTYEDEMVEKDPHKEMYSTLRERG